MMIILIMIWSAIYLEMSRKKTSIHPPENKYCWRCALFWQTSTSVISYFVLVNADFRCQIKWYLIFLSFSFLAFFLIWTLSILLVEPVFSILKKNYPFCWIYFSFPLEEYKRSLLCEALQCFLCDIPMKLFTTNINLSLTLTLMPSGVDDIKF